MRKKANKIFGECILKRIIFGFFHERGGKGFFNQCYYWSPLFLAKSLWVYFTKGKLQKFIFIFF
jgi:hypothetical protein